MKSHPFSLCIYNKTNVLPVKISEIKNKEDAFKADAIPLLTLKDDFFQKFNFIENAPGNHHLKHGDIIFIENLNRYYIFGFDINSENQIKVFGFYSLTYLDKHDKNYFRFVTYSIFENLFLKNNNFKYVCNIFIQKQAILDNIFNKIQRTSNHKLVFTSSSVQSKISFRDNPLSYYGDNEHVQFMLNDKIMNLNLNYKNKDIVNSIDILNYLNQDDTKFELKINPKIHSTVKGGEESGLHLRLYTNSIVSLKKDSHLKYIKENIKDNNEENKVLLERTKTMLFYLGSTGFCYANYLNGKEYNGSILYDSFENYIILNKFNDEKLYREVLLERL